MPDPRLPGCERGEVVKVFVPQDCHPPWSVPLLTYADGTVTRENDDTPLTPSEVAANCRPREYRPKPWKRKQPASDEPERRS